MPENVMEMEMPRVSDHYVVPNQSERDLIESESDSASINERRDD